MSIIDSSTGELQKVAIEMGQNAHMTRFPAREAMKKDKEIAKEMKKEADAKSKFEKAMHEHLADEVKKDGKAALKHMANVIEALHKTLLDDVMIGHWAIQSIHKFIVEYEQAEKQGYPSGEARKMISEFETTLGELKKSLYNSGNVLRQESTEQ